MVLARLTMLENARKNIFHVLLIGALAVIAASTLLSFFTLGVQVKILKDLSLTSIIVCGGLLAVALASTSLPAEIEHRTLYPVLARPVERWEVILGKYLGTLCTIYIGLAGISIAFALVLLRYGGELDLMFGAALGFAALEVAVIGAVATLLSVIVTPAVAAMLSLFIYISGSIKMAYLHPLGESIRDTVSKTTFLVVYHLLPNLECFNFKDALVHGIGVPGAYMAQVVIYGVAYGGVAILTGAAIFARREL